MSKKNSANSQEVFEQIIINAKTLLDKNKRKGRTSDQGGDEYFFTCPSPETYRHQWLWDSCFHVMVNSHLDMKYAKQEFETLLAHQHSNGLISHMYYWEKNFSIIDWLFQRYYTYESSSNITQTPLVPQALKAIYDHSQDLDFIKSYLPKVKRYYDYLYSTRIVEEDTVPLLNIVHSWESGIDNSPIYDKALGIEGRFLLFKWMHRLIKQVRILSKCEWDMKSIAEKNYFLYKDLLFNCAYIQGCRDLAQLYGELGKSQIKKNLQQRASELEDILLEYCWNSQENMFFGIYGNEGTQDSVKAALGFIPLILDNLPQNIASQLVHDHLLNEEEFWSHYPVPSVALDEPSYSENQTLLWRGPTWLNINWFIIKGLQKHGFLNIANELMIKTLDLIKKNDYSFREFYSPTTGKGMGAKQFAWSTLVVDLIESAKEDDQLDLIFDRDWTHIKRMDF
ncbi:MAG: amylo-alpha-1,6-glucosidase [Promethearchaeia archaeon]